MIKYKTRPQFFSHAAFSGRPTEFDGPDKDMQAANPVVEIIGKSMSK